MRSTPIRTAVLLAAAVAGATTLTGCGGPSYAVGDCVKIHQGVLDSKLESASCAGAQGTFDANARVYTVKSIIQGTSGNCPELSGFFPVQFTDEPEGVIYCLVQADGS